MPDQLFAGSETSYRWLDSLPVSLVAGLERREAVLVLMVASSCSFLTPNSYQTNLMVMEPGKYEFLDFLKFGIGLQLASMVTIIAVGGMAN